MKIGMLSEYFEVNNQRVCVREKRERKKERESQGLSGQRVAMGRERQKESFLL